MTEHLHWLAKVGEDLGLSAEVLGRIAPATNLPEAWSRLAVLAQVGDVELTAAVARHFHLGVADLTDAEERAAKLLPEAIARRHHVFPLRESDRNLVVATSDPTNLEAEQDLAFASGRRPVFSIAAPAAIMQALDARYSPDRVFENLLLAVGDEHAHVVEVVAEQQAESIGAGEVEAAPVVKLANFILHEAVAQRASDIHVEPGRHGGQVRFRVDGVMREFMPLPMPALNRVVSRLKIMGGIDIADRLRPHDGKTRLRIGAQVYDLRISTVPTRDAEKAVLRILDPEGAPTLDALELPVPELGRIRRLLAHRDGIVLVTGPTGSGKTTTLYAALRELATGEVNIMTVEDPVEYELAGITQIQVEPKRAVTFASALRAILRQDPDVILVGEIRDLETAEIALRASLTGHLVLATLHTNDAVGAIARLVDLGLDRTLIANAVRGAVAQRLARRVCAACAGRRLLEAGSPCGACGGTGYRGRVAIMEVAVVTKEVQDQIAAGADAAALQRAVEAGGMRTMRQVALDHVGSGRTTGQEVERVLGDAGDAPVVAHPPRALLVDDDGVVRTLARAVLEKQGFEVAEASDGESALQRLAEGTPADVVVLDLDMPRLGGRDVLRRLRAEVATAGLPVVVLTGSESEGLEVELMEEGADDYVRKPIDPPRFVARVRAALRRAGG
jgi:type II secretory ATPase GspE/PulE/Tfp pilus assembly ATPase PilB-like protein/ActR/RegA family two-component response regulator